MNRLGYDAAALGEEELITLGLDTVRQRLAEATFPFVSANAFDAASGERLVQPYIIVTLAGQRVAIVGLTGAADVPGVRIDDPRTTAIEVVSGLADQAEIIILLSHAGLAVNTQIAAQARSIDLIVSGGGPGMTQIVQPSPGGAPIVHADVPSIGHAGRRFGVGVWSFDGQGSLQGQEWQTVPLTPDIADDPVIQEWVAANR